MTTKNDMGIGQIAPAFNLPFIASGQEGIFDLSAYRGKRVVLYFYPKDNTSGCTAQAEAFRDHLEEFKKNNTLIVGISPDSLKSHRQFIEKYQLSFPLISDEEKIACSLYGVWVEKSMYGKKYMGVERSTFLLDEQGKILQIWRKVKVSDHICALLNYIKNL